MSTEAGFATDLDVDLDLVTDDRDPCMFEGCDSEAVMEALLDVPCNCRQLACLAHYDQEAPLWKPGDEIICYPCHHGKMYAQVEDFGVFEGWRKL